MKPRSHYLRYPIGETGWALMKILLNIAGWFLYFAQWQKSRYPCQFTLNSASCQGSLYQGASNAHPLLNDSKATGPDRGLTTPVMHTQDTLPCAGTPTAPHPPLDFSPKSREVLGSFGAKTFRCGLWKLSNPLWSETLASINCWFEFFFFPPPTFSFLPRLVTPGGPSISISTLCTVMTQRPLCLLMHIIWCLRRAAEAPRGGKTMSLNAIVAAALTYVAPLYHIITNFLLNDFPWMALMQNTVCLIIIHVALFSPGALL